MVLLYVFIGSDILFAAVGRSFIRGLPICLQNFSLASVLVRLVILPGLAVE